MVRIKGILFSAMRRILLALKDRGVTERLAKSLGSPEYKIYTSASMDEAMEIFRAEEPDLVLAELNLPPTGGDALCIDIKKNFPGNQTFVILACGTSAAELKKCGKSEADSYVKTPLDPDDIARRINSILQKDVWRAHRVLVKVRVEGSFNSEEFFCTSRNLSVTGIFLETDKSLARGDKVYCSFFLPDTERIRTDCRIMRVEKGEDGRNAYGAEFIELDDSQKKDIEDFIQGQREIGNMI